ncbi:hydroxyisourate hydrolase [Endozoicomonas ascidiicola]|uniref:hydroxyisourate hydrolase n=1 Tax=Endozoicomonas ascidiicola TaxID=1698521 RepID=UPI00082CEAAE|nr:hydroxyisourate hydrolase [Endozoicomonas ascidiicola]
MAGISTHILDTGSGAPAAGVEVKLETQNNDIWEAVGQGITDADGRISALASTGSNLKKGVYRLTFMTGDYYQRISLPCFYPEVVVMFEVSDDRHHHVPLLLSSYGYSTYRGS